MAASITFFPVKCGDMTLIELADPQRSRILIDIKITEAADNPDDPTPDVVSALRNRLEEDEQGRPYVDAFLLSHPDDDHCLGLSKYFHLGPLSDYADDEKPFAEKRIVIREMWSSPLIFRRATKKAAEEGYVLCDDALAWSTEARRRVRVAKENSCVGIDIGDRIQIMGEDENGKTDDLHGIVVKPGSFFNKINGSTSSFFSAQLLAPIMADDDEEDKVLSKNNSSVILNIQIAASLTSPNACAYLTGGDAEVEIWERLWKKYQDEQGVFDYDILLAPHHCSWRSLSNQSWSGTQGNAMTNSDARQALSQVRPGGFIVASSVSIKDDGNDPPCIGAKREYEEIVGAVGGEFLCTGEHLSQASPEPMTFLIGAEEPSAPGKKDSTSKLATFVSASASIPREHGR